MGTGLYVLALDAVLASNFCSCSVDEIEDVMMLLRGTENAAIRSRRMNVLET